jgi:hypothetical protein
VALGGSGSESTIEAAVLITAAAMPNDQQRTARMIPLLIRLSKPTG